MRRQLEEMVKEKDRQLDRMNIYSRDMIIIIMSLSKTIIHLLIFGFKRLLPF